MDGSAISDGSISDADIGSGAAIQASKIAGGSGSGLDADNLDGLSSGDFLRSNQSDFFTGDFLSIFSGKLRFASSDVAISQNGDHLLLESGNDIQLQSTDGVGIRTANPRGPLHVLGTHGDPVLMETSGSNNNYIELK